MQSLAAHAGFASWARARETLERVAEAVNQWPAAAKDLEIRPETCRLIEKSLQRTWQENRRLLAAARNHAARHMDALTTNRPEKT